MKNSLNKIFLLPQVPIVSPTPPPMYQSSHTPDPRPSTESIDPIQVSPVVVTQRILLLCVKCSVMAEKLHKPLG